MNCLVPPPSVKQVLNNKCFLCSDLFCWSLWALRMLVLLSQVLREMGEYGVSTANAYSDMLRMGDPYSVFKVTCSVT